MWTYRTGFWIAFILEIITLIVNLRILNSIIAKNLEKVGLVYNINKGTFIEGKKTSVLGAIFSLIINSIFSWAGVIIRIYSYINARVKKLETPEKVKEITYKLGLSLLTKEEVEKLVQEMADFGQPMHSEDNLDEDDFDEYNTLVLEEDDLWYRDITIEGNKLYERSHTKDWQSSFTNTYEFKFEGIKIYRRLLDKLNEFVPDKYCYVEDGVVLESDILQRRKDGKFGGNEDIEELKKECQRNEMSSKYYKIKYFIYKNHPNIISKEELIKYLKSELERIKLAIFMIKELCEKNNVMMEYSEKLGMYLYKHDEKNKKSKECLDKFNKKLDVTCEKSRCERREIDQSKQIIETLKGYLNEEEKK